MQRERPSQAFLTQFARPIETAPVDFELERFD